MIIEVGPDGGSVKHPPPAGSSEDRRRRGRSRGRRGGRRGKGTGGSKLDSSNRASGGADPPRLVVRGKEPPSDSPPDESVLLAAQLMELVEGSLDSSGLPGLREFDPELSSEDREELRQRFREVVAKLCAHVDQLQLHQLALQPDVGGPLREVRLCLLGWMDLASARRKAVYAALDRAILALIAQEESDPKESLGRTQRRRRERRSRIARQVRQLRLRLESIHPGKDGMSFQEYDLVRPALEGQIRRLAEVRDLRRNRRAQTLFAHLLETLPMWRGLPRAERRVVLYELRRLERLFTDSDS